MGITDTHTRDSGLREQQKDINKHYKLKHYEKLGTRVTEHYHKTGGTEITKEKDAAQKPIQEEMHTRKHNCHYN